MTVFAMRLSSHVMTHILSLSFFCIVWRLGIADKDASHQLFVLFVDSSFDPPCLACLDSRSQLECINRHTSALRFAIHRRSSFPTPNPKPVSFAECNTLDHFGAKSELSRGLDGECVG